MPIAPSEVAAIAEGLRAWKGFSFDTIQLWGIMPVQPGDFRYALVGAYARGRRLDLELTEGEEISLWDPEGVAREGTTLLVRAASRVTFTWGKWDLRVEGGTLHVRGGASTGESTRPLDPKDPAVKLHT